MVFPAQKYLSPTLSLRQISLLITRRFILLQLLLQEIGQLQARMQEHHDKYAVRDTPSLPHGATLLPLLRYTDADTYLALICRTQP